MNGKDKKYIFNVIFLFDHKISIFIISIHHSKRQPIFFYSEKGEPI